MDGYSDARNIGRRSARAHEEHEKKGGDDASSDHDVDGLSAPLFLRPISALCTFFKFEVVCDSCSSVEWGKHWQRTVLGWSEGQAITAAWR